METKKLPSKLLAALLAACVPLPPALQAAQSVAPEAAGSAGAPVAPAVAERWAADIREFFFGSVPGSINSPADVARARSVESAFQGLSRLDLSDPVVRASVRPVLMKLRVAADAFIDNRYHQSHLARARLAQASQSGTVVSDPEQAQMLAAIKRLAAFNQPAVLSLLSQDQRERMARESRLYQRALSVQLRERMNKMAEGLGRPSETSAPNSGHLLAAEEDALAAARSEKGVETSLPNSGHLLAAEEDALAAARSEKVHGAQLHPASPGAGTSARGSQAADVIIIPMSVMRKVLADLNDMRGSLAAKAWMIGSAPKPAGTTQNGERDNAVPNLNIGYLGGYRVEYLPGDGHRYRVIKRESREGFDEFLKGLPPDVRAKMPFITPAKRITITRRDMLDVLTGKTDAIRNKLAPKPAGTTRSGSRPLAITVAVWTYEAASIISLAAIGLLFFTGNLSFVVLAGLVLAGSVIPYAAKRYVRNYYDAIMPKALLDSAGTGPTSKGVNSPAGRIKITRSDMVDVLTGKTTIPLIAARKRAAATQGGPVEKIQPGPVKMPDVKIDDLNALLRFVLPENRLK